MELYITTSGQVRALYDEQLDWTVLGAVRITRAAQVEPDRSGRWRVDLSAVGGPQLGPFAVRSAALAAERAWLARHWR
jgi:hypothetical protein